MPNTVANTFQSMRRYPCSSKRTQIGDGRMRARQIRREHERVIREHAEALAVQDHRAPDRRQAFLELADDLPQAHDGVLVLERALEIELRGAQVQEQRPRRAARFVEHLVDLEPRRLDDDLAVRLARGRARGRAAEIRVDARLTDAGRQPLREATQAQLDDDEPFAEVVGARIELRVAGVRVREPRLVAPQGFDGVAIARFGSREQPESLSVLSAGSAIERSSSSIDCDCERL